jgi:hypothetical protein
LLTSIEDSRLEKIMKITFLLLLTMLCLGCGYSTPQAAAPQPGTKPTIAALVPNAANSGDPQFMLTVNGSSFSSNAVINWNGAAQATTRVTAGQLTATIPATAIANPGAVPVTVTNPATPGSGGVYGSGGTAASTSSPMTFTVN